MTADHKQTDLDIWASRARRMADYKPEAQSFVLRAGSQVPTLETDVGIVCHLWALADEHDELFCSALSRFHTEMYGVEGELDITRGVEVRSPANDEFAVVYLCTWTSILEGVGRIAISLAGRQIDGAIGLEVVDSAGSSTELDFPVVQAKLFERLAFAFFEGRR